MAQAFLHLEQRGILHEAVCEMEQKKFIIMKKVAKHGSQAIIVIPRILESELKPGTIA